MTWIGRSFLPWALLFLLSPPHALCGPGGPGKKDLLAGLRKVHPRILVGPGRFDALKKEIPRDPLLRKWFARLLLEGRKTLAASPSRYAIPDGLRLLATSRRVLRRVRLLALLYHLDGDRPPKRKAYLERAWKELEAAARFPDWNPRHFLDTAEMTAAFAVGYDWLYQAWTQGRKKVLAGAILEKGLKPALQAYRGKAGFGWWVKARHNWNQVCNGGIGMGALAVADVAPRVARGILRGALSSLPRALSRLAPDGGWAEGPGYWGYANRYTAMFLASLETSLGTDFGLSRTKGMDVTGLFPIFLTGPSGRTFNFADGGDHPVYGPVFFWMDRRFKNPVYARHERETPKPAPLDLLWYSRKGLSPAGAGLPLDKWYRGVQVVSFRSAWGDENAFFLAAKGGDNQANHAHLDLGSFVFEAGGVRWALDLGADDYNLPGYWSRGRHGSRWNYYRMRAEGHNTLVLNGGKGPDQDPLARARVVKFESKPLSAKAVLDLSRAYRGGAASVKRGFFFSRKPGWVLVQDEVKPLKGKGLDLRWFMHTRAEIRVGRDGATAVLSRKGRRLEARLLEPRGAKFQVLPAEPLPSSPHPKGQRKNGGVRRLSVHLGSRKFLRLAVFLRLLPAGEGKGSSFPLPRIAPLSSW